MKYLCTRFFVRDYLWLSHFFCFTNFERFENTFYLKIRKIHVCKSQFRALLTAWMLFISSLTVSIGSVSIRIISIIPWTLWTVVAILWIAVVQAPVWILVTVGERWVHVSVSIVVSASVVRRVKVFS